MGCPPVVVKYDDFFLNIIFTGLYCWCCYYSEWKEKKSCTLITIIKLYPIHNSLQPLGHSGIATDWLCTAIILVGASQTEHLWNNNISSRYYTVHSFITCVISINRYSPRYVSRNIRPQDRCHHYGHRFGSAQPITVIVSTRVVAHLVHVAEHERHGVEFLQTTPRRAFKRTKNQ